MNSNEERYIHSMSTVHISSLKIFYNKPKGLKVAKEDQRLIGLMVNGLDGR